MTTDGVEVELTLPSRATDDWFASDCCDTPGVRAHVVSRSRRGVTVRVNRAALADMRDRADYYVDCARELDPEMLGLVSSCRAVLARLKDFDWHRFDTRA